MDSSMGVSRPMDLAWEWSEARSVSLLLLLLVVGGATMLGEAWALVGECLLSALSQGGVEELDHSLDENGSEALQLLKLDLVVTVGIDLPEHGVHILIRHWSTNMVLAKELNQEETKLFTVKSVIFVGVVLLEVLCDLLLKKLLIRVIGNELFEGLGEFSLLEVFCVDHYPS